MVRKDDKSPSRKSSDRMVGKPADVQVLGYMGNDGRLYPTKEEAETKGGGIKGK